MKLPTCLIFAVTPQARTAWGLSLRKKTRAARKTAKELIGANENDNLIFTSGGSEANNQALHIASLSGKKRIIISSIEHSSVFNASFNLEKHGFEVKTVGVDKNGIVDLNDLKSLINNEPRS
ncbi:MAG: aminotransferase class V-fold PLP-dependent enzyme [Clostridia bacterium]|nr:aminotransferase class V-fold PLP-dependent enzyme [Clostridia bacterium]